MNRLTLQTVAFALGCLLALESASPAFAQSAATATGASPDAQESGASTRPVSSPPAGSTSDPVYSGASQDISPAPPAGYPDGPTKQTQDEKESLRLQQTKEVVKTQNPDPPAVEPQGAAAARLQPTTGTAASQPAGAAIAPAKQKRSRSLLISLGVLAGVGIALGTVVALSAASPGKPPGSK